MSTSNSIYSTCYVLTSCTPGNFTVLLTSTYVSQGLAPYVNQSIEVVGYPGICFRVELSDSGCADCEKEPSIIPIEESPTCTCQPIRYFLLTPCDQSLPTYATRPVSNNLYPYEGTTVTFNQFGGACYNITSVSEGNPPPEIQEIIEYLDCPTPCSCTPSFYFNLVDCCTNEIYLSNNKPVYLEYSGFCEPDTCPSDIGTKIITEFCNESFGCIQGCFKLVEVDEPEPSDTIEIVDWEDVIQEVTTVDTCEDCVQQTCYLLTNCQDEEDILVTNSDLSNYINHVISITGCQDKCWIVTESQNCENCIGKVEVIKDCAPTEYAPGNLCTYTLGDVNLDTVLSYSISINGTAYPFTFNPGDTLETILDNINGLNLGQFSIGLVGTDPVYYMAGSETYGPLCYTRCLNPPDCTSVETICVNPVCEEQDKQCAYPPISVQDASGFYFIVIDSVTYTSPTFPNLNNPGPLLLWLTGLNKGIFTVVYTPLVPGSRQITVFAYGNHVYGNLTLSITGGPNISVSPVCQPLGPPIPNCACCLPPPPPQPGELVLHPRRIKPGYFSPNSCITTEYMERVNCNFAKQVYDAMLIKRYGITVCCDHDVDSWDIKKQVLDFELLTDPELCKSTLCRCPEPCLVSVSIALVPQCLAPVIVDTSIVLQCSCFTAVGTDYTLNWTNCDGIINSADFLTNTIVCAQSVPVVVDGTATIAYVGACNGPECVIPPVI